jgi:hypothetical protein
MSPLPSEVLKIESVAAHKGMQCNLEKLGQLLEALNDLGLIV